MIHRYTAPKNLWFQASGFFLEQLTQQMPHQQNNHQDVGTKRMTKQIMEWRA